MNKNNCAAANSSGELDMLPDDSHSIQSEIRRHRSVVPRRKRETLNAERRFMMLVLSLLVLLSNEQSHMFTQASNNNYSNNNYYSQSNDDTTAGDDGNNGNSQTQTYYSGNGMTRYSDDDVFHWTPSAGFEGVSVMPISCVNYNNGHMIKYQLFDTDQSYQCHFAEISTFVVSIAHYMRAYFNYMAITQGYSFQLPADAAYLNCIPLQQSIYSGMKLYGKIGCMERETFTSTKLELHVYMDSQCSIPFEDYQSPREHARKGYKIGDTYIPTKISFKPPFYSCLTCQPDEIANTFNKKNGNWYDDDSINQYSNNNQNDKQQQANDDRYQDDYFDDKYLAANDDVSNDDAYSAGSSSNGDDYVATDDNSGGNRYLTASKEDLQAYHDGFWAEYMDMLQRKLYDNYYDIGEWNMCQRIYKYGVWCDSDCQALDFFRRDQWSTSDLILLAIMTTFMTALMLLVVAKRLKAQQRAKIYGDDHPMPGLPPFAMVIIFFVIMGVVVTLAKLKFINETLVFAVVTCILLFIYMLKLTLFEVRRPVLLAAPRHDMFDNPLDDRFID